MDKDQLIVRRAETSDAAFIVALIDRVQKKLIDSSSLQQIGPVSLAVVEEAISNSFAHILVRAGRRIGSVFVERIPAENRSLLEHWGLTDTTSSYWHLHKLAIEPDEQGQGLGYHFLAGIKSYIATQPQPAIIFLDCWAGNAKLRTFYTRAGFRLQGIHPVADFKVAVFASM
ncbi:MAG: hypothetical protein NVS4B9_06890 [Ktedonobacteraceae bacterium]